MVSYYFKGLIKQYSIEKIDAIEVPGYIKPYPKSLCHVTQDGIYNTATRESLVQYNFGKVDRVINTTKRSLFIFSFSECKMYKYYIATKKVKVCNYPNTSIFNSLPSVDET